MEKFVNIEIPEGYDIDKEKSTFEKIVFKKKDFFYPTKLGDIDGDETYGLKRRPYFSSEERATEVEALVQIIALRDAVWEIDNWTPSFENPNVAFCIYVSNNELIKGIWGWIWKFGWMNVVLIFKTKETRDWFFETHYDLMKKCKHLL